MNKIEELEKYIDFTIIGFLTIMIIPLILVISLFALPGYIICKVFKIDPDDIVNIKDTNYE